MIIPDKLNKTGNKQTKSNNLNDIIRSIILICAALIFCYSFLKLTKIIIEYRRGVVTYQNIQKQVLDLTPLTTQVDGETIEVPFTLNFSALKSINDDAIGYLFVPSLNLRFPVTHTDDNEKYLYKTIYNQTSNCGCIFVDSRLPDGLESSHTMIYGHTLNINEMFTTLHNYEKEEFYNKEGNDCFYIFTENNIRKYRIFSVSHVDSVSSVYAMNLDTPDKLQNYAEQRADASIYPTRVDISNTTQIASLITCAGDGSIRLVIQGILVADLDISSLSE